VTALGGVWRQDSKPGHRQECERVLVAQAMIGPDGFHICSDEYLSFGRRSYRLLPEDAYVRDLVQSRDGRLVLAADVRLDNRADLISELGLPVESARVMPDSAILLECLDRWDEEALDRIVGDFAFALWDRRQQSLRLARDFLGQRPLHYHRARGLFAFASMPVGLHALADVPYGPDEKAMAEFLALLPRAGSRTFFKAIERVQPAHIMTVTRDTLSSRRFWNPRRYSGKPIRFEEAVEEARARLDTAVSARLRGVKDAVGAHLSGGLDSSGVCATAAKQVARRGGKVVAFTYVPREGYAAPDSRAQYPSEEPLATETAALYPNVEHVLVRAGHMSPVANLDRLYFLYGMPFLGLPVLPPNEEIYRQARERRLTVLLIGSMGNFSLSYTGLELLPELLRRGRFLSVWKHANAIRGGSGLSRKGILAQTLGPFTPLPLWQWLNAHFTGRKHDILKNSALRPEAFDEHRLGSLARKRGFDFTDRPRQDGFEQRVCSLHQSDLGSYNKGTLAGWGIDRRDPTADKRLVEFCLSLPTEYFIHGGVQRALARQVLSDRLPASVLQERKRGHNAIDWHEGATAARADVAAELDRIAACEPATRLLNIEQLKQLVANWPQDGWHKPEIETAYRRALLRGISAGHFLRKASGANR